MTPVAGAAIHPLLTSRIRATCFSVQSLEGRLAFSATLAIASRAVAGAALTVPLLQGVLWAYVAVGLLLVGGLALSARRLARLAPAGRETSPH